jgi:hypothetical protein
MLSDRRFKRYREGSFAIYPWCFTFIICFLEVRLTFYSCGWTVFSVFVRIFPLSVYFCDFYAPLIAQQFRILSNTLVSSLAAVLSFQVWFDYI